LLYVIIWRFYEVFKTFSTASTLRLSLYRRIASSKTREALKAAESEIKERFGFIPDEVNHLLDIMRLKIMARDLRILKIHDMQGKVIVSFSPDTKVEPRDIFALSESGNRNIRFLQDGFEFILKGLTWQEIYQEISVILEELSGTTPLLV
jgi:transcription-repair coupling factor (superfamily II helicase)